jgi:hypothetical protein
MEMVNNFRNERTGGNCRAYLAEREREREREREKRLKVGALSFEH